jgi:hypothetical protein
MAKLKYDLSNVEDIPELEQAPVGTYRAKVVSAEGKESSKGNQMVEVRFHLTHDASGKKLKTEFADIWEYPILDHDHPFVQNKTKEFFTAFGMKLKGVLDTDKLVGQTVQVKLKSDTDQDGEYRPRIGKFMPVVVADEEEPEDEEPEDDEEGDDEESVDLDALDRKELKALIKEEELDITVKKSMTDDNLRELIAAAMSDDDEEESDDDEDDDDDEEEDDTKEESSEDDEEGDDYDSWAVPALKKELKDRELTATGPKKALIARLRKDDGDEPF